MSSFPASVCPPKETARVPKRYKRYRLKLELNQGFTEMFWIDFRDAQARDAYLANAKHKEIGARFLACLVGGTDGIFVCDVEL